MKKEIILYALSTAISKGSILLFFPFLTTLLSLEDFGKWSLTIIVANLLVPIMSLNGSASILREGSANQNISLIILRYFIFVTLIIGAISIIFITTVQLETWIQYSVLIALGEAIILIYLTYVRTQEQAWKYFIINLIKTFVLFLLIIYANHNKFGLNEILYYHSFIVGLFACFIIFTALLKHYVEHSISFMPILLFSIMLIPHGISQWIISSSDRIILENMLGSTSVGVYSLAYNIALVLMLVNSGIALSLPTYMIKNFKKWKSEDYDNKFMKYYTIMSIVIFLFLLIAYRLDMLYFRILGYYEVEMIPLIIIIYISIYVLGLYYFYANYLFYHKRAAIISMITFYAAFLNIILTILLTFLFGIIGTALSTLIAYIFYLYKIRRETMKIESSLNILLLKNINLFSISIALITLGYYYV